MRNCLATSYEVLLCSAPAPKYLPKRYKNIQPQNNFHKNILAPLFIIPKLEIMQISIIKGINRQIEVYSYDGTLLSNYKEWTTDTTIWMNLKNMLGQRNKSKRVHTIWFNLYEVQEHAKLIYAVSGVWRKAGKRLERGTGKLSGWWKCSIYWFGWWLHRDENLLNCTLKIFTC